MSVVPPRIISMPRIIESDLDQTSILSFPIWSTPLIIFTSACLPTQSAKIILSRDLSLRNLRATPAGSFQSMACSVSSSPRPKASASKSLGLSSVGIPCEANSTGPGSGFWNIETSSKINKILRNRFIFYWMWITEMLDKTEKIPLNGPSSVLSSWSE